MALAAGGGGGRRKKELRYGAVADVEGGVPQGHLNLKKRVEALRILEDGGR